jgi:hypothetical protein
MIEKTRDKDIRKLLRESELAKYQQDGGSLIVEELGLRFGEARIDVAVINGHLHGYEIKSDADTLNRLERQAEYYSKVFDYLWIVTGGKKVEKVKKIVPSWWGVLRVENNGAAVLQVDRPAEKNLLVDPQFIAGLLWREELLGILSSIGQDKGLRTKPRTRLIQHLASVTPFPALHSIVRKTLKARIGWRVGKSPFQGGGSSQTSANSAHSRANFEWLIAQRSPHLPR